MKKSVLTHNKIVPAVVVGLCAHGLGMVRNLARAGIQVIALESDKTLPGVKTNCASINFVADINGPSLLDALVKLAEERAFPNKPVLLLTNDKMSKTIGENLPRITPFYRLSWARSADHVLQLLNKENIELRCRKTGLNYPRSVVIGNTDNLLSKVRDLAFPIIIKPVRPLSAFKTLVINSQDELSVNLALIGQCLPVLVQEFILGDDQTIRFGAMYLHDGKVIARFEGRKLFSRPMGLTTIAVSEPNDPIHDLAARFFDGLGLSGPVSLELKQGPDGRHWVMEPTVGRTDFWEGLCSANGVDFPLLEYEGESALDFSGMKQISSHVWVNGERHRLALFWLLRHAPRTVFRFHIRGVYADGNDMGPFWGAVIKNMRSFPSRTLRKLEKIVRGEFA